MCRASLESSGNVVKAEAVNDGIVYLMVFPYILVAVVGYVVYSMFRRKKVKTT
ncbi:FeoB-associated Cys-rich membrane protein [Flavobacterium sp.]|uniref:FeoB-associated Cys-rich membrane protein n=2 Tax=Flavobacterium sp. TaxID=239 RepID=UPI00345CFB4D